MEVDLRQFPKLLNELAPKISRKDRTLSSAEVRILLKEEFGIDAHVNPYSLLYWVEMDEEMFTWVSLKWK